MIKLPKNVQIEEIPLETMYRGVLRGLLTRIKILYETIYSRYGNDGLDLIREVSEKCGQDIAKKVHGDNVPGISVKWDFSLLKCSTICVRRVK